MSEREAADEFYNAPVSAIRAVSAARARLLAKMGLDTVRDVLSAYPNRYIDLGSVHKIARAPINENATVVGIVDDIREKRPSRRMHIVEAAIVDESGVLMAVWFRQPWMLKKLQVGMKVAVAGKVAFDYGFKRINSPFLEVLGTAEDAKLPAMRLVPVHSVTERLSTAMMRRIVANALAQAGDIHDPLPCALREMHVLVSKKAALRDIHFPPDALHASAARRRLAYEEVLTLQVEMMRRRAHETRGMTAVQHVAGDASRALRAALPFELTDEQNRAVADIERDMVADACMNRMLLGDVGTGKTIVAGLAACLAADTGCQAAMMAPTEVLARQYGVKLGGMFDTCGVQWACLTGSTSAAERAEILDSLASGRLQVLFGTHALIEPDVVFRRMSLAIIDEQHRFGVNQRAALRAKGPGCDLLVMTATPIPRTLALTLYGDLQTSYIRTRPTSAPPVLTTMISRDARRVGYEAIRSAVGAGRQAYIICPLVGLSSAQREQRESDGSLLASLRQGSDISDAKAAESEAVYLQTKVFPEYRVGLLTGRMSTAEKNEVMEQFRAAEIDVLVATTVVEVGVDVSNATVMMIEDAERFGLSQLHQLRGRVARSNVRGELYLVADPKSDDTEMQRRMRAICEIDDGFALAEEDLRTRREGDVLGSRQHGQAALKLVNVIEDAALIECAHEDAAQLLAGDPELEDPQNRALRSYVDTLFSQLDSSVSAGA